MAISERGNERSTLDSQSGIVEIDNLIISSAVPRVSERRENSLFTYNLQITRCTSCKLSLSNDSGFVIHIFSTNHIKKVGIHITRSNVVFWPIFVKHDVNKF